MLLVCFCFVFFFGGVVVIFFVFCFFAETRVYVGVKSDFLLVGSLVLFLCPCFCTEPKSPLQIHMGTWLRVTSWSTSD